MITDIPPQNVEATITVSFPGISTHQYCILRREIDENVLKLEWSDGVWQIINTAFAVDGEVLSTLIEGYKRYVERELQPWGIVPRFDVKARLVDTN